MRDMTALRAVLCFVGIVLVGDSVTQAQAAGAPGSAADLDLVRWAMTQGGLVLVTLVLLWSYRRDFKTVLAAQDQVIGVLTGLVRETTIAIEDSAAAKRELAQVIQVQQWRPSQRHDTQ